MDKEKPWERIIGGTYSVGLRGDSDKPAVIFEFEGFVSDEEAYKFIEVMEIKIEEMFPRYRETVH